MTTTKTYMNKYSELEKEEIIYIGGMFPVGRLSCLVGNGGIGKSYTLMFSSLSVTDKRLFLPKDDYPLFDDREVLVIDTENRSRSFYERLVKVEADTTKYYVPKDFNDTVISTSEKDLELIEELAKDDKTIMIIIDSLAGFNAGIEENSIESMISVKWLGYIARKYNKAIVITHFLNKSEVSNKITTGNIRGHSSIQQFIELIWAIDNEKGSEEIKRLYQIKNNIEKIDNTIYTFKLTEFEPQFITDITTNELSGKQRRIKLYDENITKSDKEIAAIILNEEPTQQLNNILNWIKRRRNISKAV